MADSGFQLVLNSIAQIVGGTAVSTVPHFYSGVKVGDGTGISGVKGCWSSDPPSILATPVGIVIPQDFRAELRSQGEETNLDRVMLVLLAAPYDGTYQLPVMTPFRDLVPAAFRAHMSALGTAGVESCWVSSGRTRLHQYGGIDYLAWEFTIDLDRALSVTYAP